MERYILPQQEKTFFESLRQAFAIYQFVDKRVVTLVLSDGFCDLFGYKDRALAYFDMDNNMYRDTHPDDTARIANAAFRFATEGGRYEVIYRTKIAGTSDYRIVHAYGEHVYTDTGVRLAHVWYSDEGLYTGKYPSRKAEPDLSAQGGKDPHENAPENSLELELNPSLSNALHENSIVKASQYDYLTGLPSMSYFFELAEAEKKGIGEEDGKPVLMYMDFGGMKFYNRKHGFAAGDKLLRSFAKILAKTFGNEHSCRIGADHFAVQTREKDLDKKLRKMFLECREINGGNSLPVHVGVYVGQHDTVHTSVACDRAKLACGALSGRYESSVHYYSQDLSVNAEKKQYIIENFERAMAKKWIRIYLQPIIRAVNGRVCDVEALARWIDPEKGVLSPADFIPALEDAGLIYRLDLYVLEQVLASIKIQMAEGFHVIPHSINLSRSDFDACDMVEEIRRRVDEAGISRDRITIEITESVIGSDFEFMKGQVERFQKLGFPVWMDDFGSGYSSLDVLQSIRFDLLKFDMSFMRRLDEGDSGKIILSELMKMATSLGLDTVCEGVENETQVQFLQEIGCSKLQGFYYSRPMPFESIREMYQKKALIENENPRESDYYESISRANLYDLGVITGGEADAFQNVFDTLPIAILEVRDGRTRYIRSSRSYRDFVQRFFNVDILKDQSDFGDPSIGYRSTFSSFVRQCCDHGNRHFFDEKMPDGSVVHSFVRRISSNPVTGSVAIAIAILSISEPDDRETYVDIARALAADYYNIYVIDLDTDDYVEYSSKVGGEELSIERRGRDFFGSARRDTMTRIYEADREPFLSIFTKERVLQDLDRQGVFTTTYRLIDTGSPMYVNMKITRMHGGNRIILGISIIDAHMKQKAKDEKLKREKISLGRIAALSPSYLVLYTVDPVTGHYMQYSPSGGFEQFGLAKQGEDFFTDVRLDAPKAIAPEDLERHLQNFTKENMMRGIRENGFYTYYYHLLLNGKSVPVSLRATLVQESDGEKILLGVTNDEKEERLQEELVVYARLHALTGNFICVYVVDPETDRYREFSATDKYTVNFAQAKEGMDFFSKVREVAPQFNHPEDLEHFLAIFSKENILSEIRRSGIFTLGYRLMMEGKPLHVQMKAALVEEKEGPRLIVGVNDIDAQVRQEQNYKKRLAQAQAHASIEAMKYEKRLAQIQARANIDALTGVKNKHAYLETEVRMDRLIANRSQPPFAVTLFDVNNLKKINDTAGHQAGDQYIRGACRIICDIFKHSPVFRIGGDEFAVISEGNDYQHIREYLEKMSRHNAEAARSGGIVIACGMSVFEQDDCVASVFERADHRMYENKNMLKADQK